LLNTGFEAGLPTQAQLSLATAQQQALTANADLEAFRLVTLGRGFSSRHVDTDVDFNACTNNTSCVNARFKPVLTTPVLNNTGVAGRKSETSNFCQF
jgi:hypothetical protein